jgi:hypothetical protein
MGGYRRSDRAGQGRHRAKTPLGPRLRRATVVLVASMGAMLGLSAAGVAEPPAAAVDQRFLVDVRERGHVVAVGTDEELLVSAARKLCKRRDTQSYEKRRTRGRAALLRRRFAGLHQAGDEVLLLTCDLPPAQEVGVRAFRRSRWGTTTYFGSFVVSTPAS